MSALAPRRISTIAATVSVSLFLLAFYYGFYPHQEDSNRPVVRRPFGSREVRFPSVSNRKLLVQGPLPPSSSVEQPERVGDECSKDDIVVHQGATEPLPSGIPTYTVEVLNVCLRGCAMARIHLSCGWFSSARLVNPRVFRRLRYDDCLLNDGRPLQPGASISFQYANSFRYPLQVSSAQCLPNT